MATHRLRLFFLTCTPMVALSLAILPTAGLGSPWQQTQITLPAALDKPMPETVQDLMAIEAHVKIIVAKVMPAVVNVKSEGKGGQGSGVVVSEDGYVLTAAHVIPQENGIYVLTFPDGKKVKAKASAPMARATTGFLRSWMKANIRFAKWANPATSRKASGASPLAIRAASSQAAPRRSASAGSSRRPRPTTCG